MTFYFILYIHFLTISQENTSILIMYHEDQYLALLKNGDVNLCL